MRWGLENLRKVELRFKTGFKSMRYSGEYNERRIGRFALKRDGQKSDIGLHHRAPHRKRDLHQETADRRRKKKAERSGRGASRSGWQLLRICSDAGNCSR